MADSYTRFLGVKDTRSTYSKNNPSTNKLVQGLGEVVQSLITVNGTNRRHSHKQYRRRLVDSEAPLGAVDNRQPGREIGQVEVYTSSQRTCGREGGQFR